MRDELLEEQIKKTARILGLPADFIRKDFYVTQAIQILTHIQDEYFSLVFQGGTSLSKGYQVIHRLSEDIDFRVVLKPAALSLGKEAKRNRLRDFRYSLVKALSDAGFLINQDDVKVFYEGRFMSIRASFDNASAISYLRPHIAIECFVGELLLPTQTTEISSLIKVTLGDECDHLLFPVNCVSLDETAAEKWVALTRRVATAKENSKESDKHLVRHIYDLYQLHQKSLLTGDYVAIARQVIEKDREMYKNTSEAYANNPLETSENALNILLNNPVWQEHWDLFLEQMVYSDDKPLFSEAYEQLKLMTQKILDKKTESHAKQNSMLRQ